MLGLYLHIPFCSAICNYCNFNRGLFESGLKDRYVAALEREIRSSARGHADTIFFGGGTPSLLDPSESQQAHHRLPRKLRPGAGRRDHPRDQPGDVVGGTDGTIPRRGCQSPKLRRPVVSRRGARAAGTDSFGGSRPRGGGRGARRRVRQHQPGSDDVAAATDARKLARERRIADRRPAGARLALSAGAVSQRAAEGGHGARRMVAGAR